MHVKQPNEKELAHESVYGSSFALYDRQALAEFIEPFKVRFDENKLVPGEVFRGRRCLDAGCGNGRGSIFMLQNGAAHVTAVDISDKNVQTTRRNLAEYGFANFSCKQTSLELLPFEAESFDFVWCNGVVMHTANPDGCIFELARVLKPGAGMWLYVYGAGGVYWEFVRHFRLLFSDTSVDQIIGLLTLCNYPVRFIAEYVDDWKTPFLRAYRQETLERKLQDLGFQDVKRLWGGMPYDTCARIIGHPQDRPFLGEGDLRYLAVRGSLGSGGRESLSANHIDETPEIEKQVKEVFGSDLRELMDVARSRKAAAIVACARLQLYLRQSVLSTRDAMDVDALSNYLKETIRLLRST